jgi:RHS repeat-associated protein
MNQFRLALAVLLSLFWTAPLIAEAPPGAATYRVTLVLYPGDDPAAVARRLAAMYRGTLETPVDGNGSFTISLFESGAQLMRRDPVVAEMNVPLLASPVPESAVPATAAVPATQRPVETNATTSWTLGPYQYDGSGNIGKIGSDFYVYDKLGRIVVSADAQPSVIHKQTYTYDPYGNLRSIDTAGGTPATLEINGFSNRLASVSTGSASAPIGYDGAGNFVSYLGATYEYDALNVMRRSVTGGVTRSYIYTANDERIGTIEQTGPAIRSEWTLRDIGGQVLRRYSKESNGNWKWQEDYIYRGSQMLAAELPGSPKTLHFHLDHLGTPRLITGNGGSEISRHNYRPFGEEIVPSAAAREKKQFTGHERDSESLDYMHARFYAPLMGRFLSVDPALDLKRSIREPQSWNRYAYVNNNPIRRIDPDGRVDGNSDDFARQLFPDDRRAQLDFDQDVAVKTAIGSAATVAAIYGGPPAWRALGRLAAVASFQLRIALSGATSIMVGQTMSRVNSAANQTGSLTFEATGLAQTTQAMWAQNQAFLQNAISKGHRIFDVGSNPALKNPGYFHPREVAFLTKQGYQRVHAGWVVVQGQAVRVFEWVKRAE